MLIGLKTGLTNAVGGNELFILELFFYKSMSEFEISIVFFTYFYYVIFEVYFCVSLKSYYFFKFREGNYFLDYSTSF